MAVWRIKYRGDGYEVHEIEAETEEDARSIAEMTFPLERYIEGAEFHSAEVIEP